jgi:hypothetical protein
MNFNTKGAIRDFIFPVSNTGEELYDNETHYKKIEVNYVVTSSILAFVTRADVYQAERNALKLLINTKKDVRELFGDTNSLLNFLNKDKEAFTYHKKLKKTSLPKHLKKCLYLLDEIRFEGKPISTKEEITVLSHYLHVINVLERAVEPWNNNLFVQQFSILETYYFLKQATAIANEITVTHKNGKSVLSYLLAKEFF